MKYISAEEFLRQPKEVQEVFIDWWKPSKGDIYCNLYNGQENNVLVINDCQFIFKSFKDDIKEYGIPLLAEGQLREFIEDKTGTVAKVIQWHIEDNSESNRGYSIYIDLLERNKYQVTRHYKNLGEDLLQAYWKVVCEIAEGEVNKNE